MDVVFVLGFFDVFDYEICFVNLGIVNYVNFDDYVVVVIILYIIGYFLFIVVVGSWCLF